MTRRICSLVAILILAAQPLHTRAASPAQATVAARIGTYMRSLVSRGAFSGNILVARNGNIVFQHSYGYANEELRVPNTAATRFRIFSTTKQFTAVAIVLLAQRGKLRIGDSVRTYLPMLPASWQPVTLRELLQHTSGLPQLENDWGDGFLSKPGIRTQLQNLVVVLPDLRKSAPVSPGTTWKYNNFGYDLLGCVVEAVSHQPYTAFVETNIMQRAGMRDSGFVGQALRPEIDQGYDGPAVVPSLASGYNGAAGLPADLQTSMAYQYASAGAGDIYATAQDLLRYSNALDSGTLLTRTSQREMVDGAFPLRKHEGYGYGWIVYTIHGHRFVHHSGGTNGYAVDFARFPEEHASIIVLSNFGFAEVEKIRAVIAGFMFGNKYAIAAPKT